MQPTARSGVGRQQWSKQSPKELAAYPGGGGAANAVSAESRLQARHCYQMPALSLLARIFTNQLLREAPLSTGLTVMPMK